MFTKNSKLDRWEKDCEKQKFQFATIQTNIAVYDRAAVISKSDTSIAVEYPKKDKKGNISIKRDMISVRNIDRIRYYSN